MPLNAVGQHPVWTNSRNCTSGASGVVKKEASDRVSDMVSDAWSDTFPAPSDRLSDTFPPLDRHSWEAVGRSFAFLYDGHEKLTDIPLSAECG